MLFHTDTLLGKITILLALIGARELVRLFSPKPVPVSPQNRRSPATQESDSSEDGTKWLIETLDSAAIAIGLVLFIIQPFLLQAFYIPSGSMEDTLQYRYQFMGRPMGDRLLISKLIYRLRDPKFQEIVVFKAPPEALRESASSAADETTGEETDFIKRCIGTPGDMVEAINGKYYHNGKLIDEPYVKWADGGIPYYDMKIVDGKVYHRDYQNDNSPGPWMWEQQQVEDAEAQRVENAAPGRVPAGQFLMLGDHRSNSLDSHFWGFVPRANILGKAIAIFWPPPRLGLLDRSVLRHSSASAVTP